MSDHKIRIVVVGDPDEEVYQAVVSPSECTDSELLPEAIERLFDMGLSAEHQFTVECEMPEFRPTVQGKVTS